MPGKINVVEWLDPKDSGDHWMTREEALKDVHADLVVCCGPLFYEDELTLVLSSNEGVDDGTIFGKHIIPKSHIVRRKEYAYPWKGKRR